MITYQRQAMNTDVPEENLLDWGWIIAQIEQSHHYWLSTTRTDGRPHVVPMAAIWSDNGLFFGTRPQSVKVHNITHQPHVAIHLESSTHVVILEGQVETAALEIVQQSILAPYKRRYHFIPPTTNSNWYVLYPQRVLAWIFSDSYNTATRWVRIS